MVQERFPKSKQEVNKKAEDVFFEICTDQDTNLDKLIAKLKQGYWLSVIVTTNYNIYLSDKTHAEAMAGLGLAHEPKLMANFAFRLWADKEGSNAKIDFEYDFDPGNDPEIETAVKNKIKQLLASRGITAEALPKYSERNK